MFGRRLTETRAPHQKRRRRRCPPSAPPGPHSVDAVRLTGRVEAGMGTGADRASMPVRRPSSCIWMTRRRRLQSKTKLLGGKAQCSDSRYVIRIVCRVCMRMNCLRWFARGNRHHRFCCGTGSGGALSCTQARADAAASGIYRHRRWSCRPKLHIATMHSTTNRCDDDSRCAMNDKRRRPRWDVTTT